MRQLSDQKIRQIVVNKAVAIGQSVRLEVEETIKNATRPVPKIASEIAIYDRDSREILVFEDAIQVRGQKENRDNKQLVVKELIDQHREKTRTPAIQTDLVMLEKQDGQFDYLTALIDDRGNELISLPDLLRSRIIEEYGMESEPLPIVAITNGAKVIREHLAMTFGVAVVIILDWLPTLTDHRKIYRRNYFLDSSMTFRLLLLIFLLAPSLPVAVASCLHYGGSPVILNGKVKLQTFLEPPNYDENPGTDSRETQAILLLDNPVCVEENPRDYEKAEQNQREITLVPFGKENLQRYAGVG